MGILDRIFGGHGGGHGGSHGHGSSHGHGGPSSHDWGRNPAPSASGITCPQCKAINPNGARFCGQCGTSLVPASCTKCSSVIPIGAKFCAQCGNAVT